MIDREILFIFGAPRSGTTYVNALLREHFGYALCSEGEFVLQFARRHKKYGDLESTKNLDRLIKDVCREEMLEHFRTYYSEYYAKRMEVTASDIWRNLPERSWPGVVYSVFSSVAEQMGLPRIGNKNPNYSYHLSTLYSWFPNAKFLHVVRDGRDVALSTARIRWGAKSSYSNAKSWAKIQQLVHEFAQNIPPQKLFHLYYEKLLRSPEVVIGNLEKFLEVDLCAEGRAKFIQDIMRNSKRWNFGKWQKEMTAKDVRIYEAVARRWLSERGYVCQCRNPRVSTFDRSVYEANEILRKASLTMREYLSVRPRRG